MPSEARRPLVELLHSQGLGVLCGLATVGLLCAGSVVLDVTREGASAGIAMDDLTAFFTRPSPVHAWLYLVALVLAVWALNAVLCTWQSVLRKWRSGLRAPSAYAAAVVHLSLLVALVAHLVGGLFGAEAGQVALDGAWRPLPTGGEARVVALEAESYPGGMPKAVRARVERVGAGGGIETAEVGFNEPLTAGLGSELYLLSDWDEVPAGVRFSIGTERCRVARGVPCRIADRDFGLLGFAPPGHLGSSPAARLTAKRDGVVEELWTAPGRETKLADGTALAVEAFENEPAILLRARRAPGNPVALASALLLALGIGLMWRRFAPTGVAP